MARKASISPSDNSSANLNMDAAELCRVRQTANGSVKCEHGSQKRFLANSVFCAPKETLWAHTSRLPLAELTQPFTIGAGALHLQYSTIAAQSRTPATLRDTLLPKLLSGELSVRTLESTATA